MTSPLILMYHRIAHAAIDPWRLAVSPAHFEEHLDILRRTRHPLPLTEFVRRLFDGALQPDAVAVTFDDGYVDNLTAGLPRLAAAGVPATVFLATGFIDRREPFWWDEIAGLVLREDAPETFAVEIGGQRITCALNTEFPEAESIDGSVRRSTDRRAMLDSIYEPLRHLGDDERRATVAKLRAILSKDDIGASLGRPMTGEEIRTLVADSLVAVGAHTVTHPSLPKLPSAAQCDELVRSKRLCESFVEAPVTAFAYPYGEYNAEVREAVKRAGFAIACTSLRGPAGAALDGLAMPRIFIPDQDGDAFERRIRWASALGEETG